MRDIDWDICETQGNIYQLAAKEGYDMGVFSDVYLRSDFCGRYMDAVCSRFQIEDETVIWEFFFPELGGRLRKCASGREYNGRKAYWIGYTYRQLAYRLGKHSRELADGIPFKRMDAAFGGCGGQTQDVIISGLMADGALLEGGGRKYFTGEYAELAGYPFPEFAAVDLACFIMEKEKYIRTGHYGLIYYRYENAIISLKCQRDNGTISEDEFWGITRLLTWGIRKEPRLASWIERIESRNV